MCKGQAEQQGPHGPPQPERPPRGRPGPNRPPRVLRGPSPDQLAMRIVCEPAVRAGRRVQGEAAGEAASGELARGCATSLGLQADGFRKARRSAQQLQRPSSRVWVVCLCACNCSMRRTWSPVAAAARGCWVGLLVGGAASARQVALHSVQHCRHRQSSDQLARDDHRLPCLSSMLAHLPGAGCRPCRRAAPHAQGWVHAACVDEGSPSSYGHVTRRVRMRLHASPLAAGRRRAAGAGARAPGWQRPACPCMALPGLQYCYERASWHSPTSHVALCHPPELLASPPGAQLTQMC